MIRRLEVNILEARGSDNLSFIYTLSVGNMTTVSEKGEADLNPYPLVGTSIILTVVIQSYASNLEELAC